MLQQAVFHRQPKRFLLSLFLRVGLVMTTPRRSTTPRTSSVSCSNSLKANTLVTMITFSSDTPWITSSDVTHSSSMSPLASKPFIGEGENEQTSWRLMTLMTRFFIPRGQQWFASHDTISRQVTATVYYYSSLATPALADFDPSEWSTQRRILAVLTRCNGYKLLYIYFLNSTTLLASVHFKLVLLATSISRLMKRKDSLPMVVTWCPPINKIFQILSNCHCMGEFFHLPWSQTAWEFKAMVRSSSSDTARNGQHPQYYCSQKSKHEMKRDGG